MTLDQSSDPVRRRLRDDLYSDAMLLADEARAYFDEIGRKESAGLGPIDRVRFSCESLKVTTRLMHVVAWLLTQRAVAAGEIAAVTARSPSRRLGDAPVTEGDVFAMLPARAQELVAASVDLHRRTARLNMALDAITDSPARAMQRRLVGAF